MGAPSILPTYMLPALWAGWVAMEHCWAVACLCWRAGSTPDCFRKSAPHRIIITLLFLSFFLPCVYKCDGRACPHVCSYAHVHAYVCKPEVDIGYLPRIVLPFLYRGLVTWRSLIRQIWLSSLPQDPLSLPDKLTLGFHAGTVLSVCWGNLNSSPHA